MGKKSLEDVSLKKLELKLMYSMCAVIFLLVGFVTTIMVVHSSRVIMRNSAKLISGNAEQIQLNIDLYLKNIEKTSTLLFSDESYYKYDATVSYISEYDKVLKEEKIDARIVDLGIMENFSDFGIVYSDNHTVGWISNTTKNYFKDGLMYETFEKGISNTKTRDGWMSGVCDSFDRIYYVKRLNKNAILIASIYSRELNMVFDVPDELEGMSIRLVDDDNTVLYSSTRDEIGEPIIDSIGELIEGVSNGDFSSKADIIVVNSCTNGWRVVCQIPTEIVLKELRYMATFAIGFAIIIAIVFAVICILSFNKLAKPVDGIVSDLEDKAATDGMTGLLNKTNFQEIVSNQLALVEANDIVAFAIMDIDNFKQINDNLGHDYGDKVIIKAANMLSEKLGADMKIGRIGGDEFGMFCVERYTTLEEFIEKYKTLFGRLGHTFLEEFKEENKKYKLSVSFGAYIDKASEQDFDTIFKLADEALYNSKNTGKATFTFFDRNGGQE